MHPLAVRAIARAVTVQQQVAAATNLARPGYWLGRRVNPHSPEAGFEHRRHAAAFRLDMLGQCVFGRPIAREAWVGSVLDRASKLPEGRRLPMWVATSDWESAYAEARREQHPLVLRGWLETQPGYVPWDDGRFLQTYAKDPVALTCPVWDGYPGRVEDLRIPGVYLHNSETLIKRHPKLLREAGFHHLPRTLAKDMRYSGISQLFVGRKKTGTFWHCAAGANLFVMLSGRKRWRFIDPAASPLLFPRTPPHHKASYFQSDYGASSSTFAEVARLGNVDPGLDAGREQAFSRCDIREVVLEPGDVLFNPPWWWHDVENLDESTTGLATRWGYPWVLANPTFDVSTRLNGDYLYNLVKALVAQQVVRDGELQDVPPDSWTPVVEQRNRGNAITGFVGVKDDIVAYYRAHGATWDPPPAVD